MLATVSCLKPPRLLSTRRAARHLLPATLRPFPDEALRAAAEDAKRILVPGSAISKLAKLCRVCLRFQILKDWSYGKSQDVPEALTAARSASTTKPFISCPSRITGRIEVAATFSHSQGQNFAWRQWAERVSSPRIAAGLMLRGAFTLRGRICRRRSGMICIRGPQSQTLIGCFSIAPNPPRSATPMLATGHRVLAREQPVIRLDS